MWTQQGGQDPQQGRLAGAVVPQHGQGGAWVSELFPNVAKCADDLCIIRSIHGSNSRHGGALLELHTLQALDATLAGASLRDVAEGLFGVDAAAGWYSDGGLRSKVRRLTRRGDALMRGGYRRLAQLAPLEKGRFEGHAKRP